MPAFLWSQSDVFNYIGQNPRRLFPWLQPVSERYLEARSYPRTRALSIPSSPPELCADSDTPAVKLTPMVAATPAGRPLPGGTEVVQILSRWPALCSTGRPWKHRFPDFCAWCLQKAQLGVHNQEGSEGGHWAERGAVPAPQSLWEPPPARGQVAQTCSGLPSLSEPACSPPWQRQNTGLKGTWDP